MTDYYDFAQAAIGDEIRFLTRDNGFGGTGESIERTGTITAKTDVSITVYVGGGEWVFRAVGNHGKTSLRGATARIRRADWSGRDPRLIRRKSMPGDEVTRPE
jgi:hypothetical protein